MYCNVLVSDLGGKEGHSLQMPQLRSSATLRVCLLRNNTILEDDHLIVSSVTDIIFSPMRRKNSEPHAC